MKKIIIGLFAVLLLVIAASIYCVWLFSIPADCNVLHIETYCAKISDTGEIQPHEGEVTVYLADLDQHEYLKPVFRHTASILRQLQCTKTQTIPSDAQILQFRFVDDSPENHNKLWEEYIAFDFYTKKLFVFREGKWYSTKENKRLNAFIEENLNISLQYTVWRGQSTYAPEEFVDSDFENASFRYNLYWKQSEYHDEESYNWRRNGFTNTAAANVLTKEDALSCAAEELGYANPAGTVLYDETCGFWMVELYEDDPAYREMSLDDFCASIHDIAKTVIIDNQGKTVEIYDCLTRYRAFFD